VYDETNKTMALTAPAVHNNMAAKDACKLKWLVNASRAFLLFFLIVFPSTLHALSY